VVKSRGEVKTTSAVFGLRLAGEGRVEDDDKLAGGMDGQKAHDKDHDEQRQRG
jgi:hypothetical protein